MTTCQALRCIAFWGWPNFIPRELMHAPCRWPTPACGDRTVCHIGGAVAGLLHRRPLRPGSGLFADLRWLAGHAFVLASGGLGHHYPRTRYDLDRAHAGRSWSRLLRAAQYTPHFADRADRVHLQRPRHDRDEQRVWRNLSHAESALGLLAGRGGAEVGHVDGAHFVARLG